MAGILFAILNGLFVLILLIVVGAVGVAVVYLARLTPILRRIADRLDETSAGRKRWPQL